MWSSHSWLGEINALLLLVFIWRPLKSLFTGFSIFSTLCKRTDAGQSGRQKSSPDQPARVYMRSRLEQQSWSLHWILSRRQVCGCWAQAWNDVLLHLNRYALSRLWQVCKHDLRKNLLGKRSKWQHPSHDIPTKFSCLLPVLYAPEEEIAWKTKSMGKRLRKRSVNSECDVQGFHGLVDCHCVSNCNFYLYEA